MFCTLRYKRSHLPFPNSFLRIFLFQRVGYVFSFPRNSSQCHKTPKVLLQTWRLLQSSPYAQIIASVKEQQQSVQFSPKKVSIWDLLRTVSCTSYGSKTSTWYRYIHAIIILIHCIMFTAYVVYNFIISDSDTFWSTWSNICVYVYIYIYRNNIHTCIHIISYSIITLLIYLKPRPYFSFRIFLKRSFLHLHLHSPKNTTPFKTPNHPPSKFEKILRHLQGATRISNHRIH